MAVRITDSFKEVKKRHNNFISASTSTSSRKDPIPSTSTEEQQHKDPDLEVLKQFDLRLEFGPCIGITRKERWERAEKHGLSPPQEVLDILLRHPDNDTYLQSLWKDYNI
ncbi:DNA polymerase delta subunit 4-like [Pomacea canaliculata]|uniref:DNA polymerase delta subunit 4-like n=1 Tax=Pomacea canaliculata TaxID=400727 RepID=UPI000D72958C|nr:DNA polymerase delta subunit 4-like [Pomacea canaliculata]